MELLVFDPELKGRGVLDIFDSLIWVDRYDAYGDVEFDTYSIIETLSVVRENDYLVMANSQHTMIVDTIEIKTDVERGNKLVIKGRSLESILDRRIIWDQTILTGSLQDGILKLLNDNAINPIDPDRKINKLIFIPSEDPRITMLTIDAQFTGDNLYDVISAICLSYNIGFKILHDENGNFVFSLYSGNDRSYDQLENPYVVFSPNFDNILNGEYLYTNKLYKTVTLVAGEGEGSDRKKIAVAFEGEAGSDLDRREIFTDAREISQTTEEGELTDEEYYAQLAQKGKETLIEMAIETVFEGQLQPNSLYIYGEDFFMGDTLQIADSYGHEGKVQITEFSQIQDAAGFRMYPSFITLV